MPFTCSVPAPASVPPNSNAVLSPSWISPLSVPEPLPFNATKVPAVIDSVGPLTICRLLTVSFAALVTT